MAVELAPSLDISDAKVCFRGLADPNILDRAVSVVPRLRRYKGTNVSQRGLWSKYFLRMTDTG